MSVDPSTSSFPRIERLSIGPLICAKKLTKALPNASERALSSASISKKLSACMRTFMLILSRFEKSKKPDIINGLLLCEYIWKFSKSNLLLEIVTGSLSKRISMP